MIGKKVYLFIIMILFSVSALAGSEVSLYINNEMVRESRITTNMKNVVCMWGTLRFAGVVIEGHATYQNQVENAIPCSTPTRFTLVLTDTVLKKTIAEINYEYPGGSLCDPKVWKVKNMNPSRYNVTHDCKLIGQYQTMSINVKFQTGLTFVGDLNIINRTEKQSPKTLKLIGNGLPVPPNNSGYYQTGYPATITDKAQVKFLPLAKMPNFGLTVFEYGYDKSTACAFAFTWAVDKCTVMAKSSNDRLLACSANASPIVGNACTATFTATDLTMLPILPPVVPIIPYQYVTVNVKNNSKDPLQLNAYTPPASSRTSPTSSYFKYNPVPAATISSNGAETYVFSGPDGSTATLSYGLSQNFYCELAYSNTAGVCAVRATAHGSELLRKLQCDAKVTDAKKCVVQHDISVVDKARFMAITLNNNVTLKGNPQTLTRSDLTPAAKNYPEVPPATIKSPTKVDFSYEQDATSNQAGSVRYSLDANHYCDLTYDWQYAKNPIDGCKIGVATINKTTKDHKLVCSCNQQAGSNECGNKTLVGQNCKAEITVYAKEPLVPLKVPTSQQVELQNIYYYDLELQNEYGYFTKKPPVTIPPSTYSKFTAGSQTRGVKPRVKYILKGSANRGCEFTFYWDAKKDRCIAEAVTTNKLNCNVAKAAYNKAAQSCDYVFSVGGNAELP